MIREKHSAIIASLSSVRDYIRWAASRFSEAELCFGHGTANALDEAAALVLHALHLSHDLPDVYFAAALTADERVRIVELVERRIVERKPLPYLLGEAWFGGLPFYVDERVLVPRSPLGELIGKHFEPWIEPERVTAILDLCTGSGCIAVLAAQVFPDAEIHAVDVSDDALAVARENLRRHSVEESVTLIASDLFTAIPKARYDIIVSNPPYVSRTEWEHLPSEYHAEPRLGLEAGADGLDCVRRILAEAVDHLNPGGILVVEVGSSAESLLDAYRSIPFTWVEFEHGGDGVFLLTASQLAAHRAQFEEGITSVPGVAFKGEMS